MVSKWKFGDRRKRRGAATVELALVLPIFLMLIVGIIEFGRAFMVQQMVTYAAREGARHAALAGVSNTQVAQKVKDHLSAGGIDPEVVTVTVSPTNLQNAPAGTPVNVGTSVRYLDVAWMPIPWFLGQVDLTSETVMRRE